MRRDAARGERARRIAAHAVAGRVIARQVIARRVIAGRAIAGLAVIGLALPLAACTLGEANGVGLVRAGCPEEIRIQTDDLPRVEWGFLYGLLDRDELRIGRDSVTAPLLIDGRDSGARLRIGVGDPDDGISANVDLYDDERVLLGAVDTDVAIRDAKRYPTVGVFAPLLRDTRIAYWDSRLYPGVATLPSAGRQATPDGSALVPFAVPPRDPFIDYALGNEIFTADQIVTEPAPTVPGWIDASGVPVQVGDLLTDPYEFQLLTDARDAFSFQRLDEAGYPRDHGVLSARPEALVRYADCLTVLVPVLQHALADYLNDPENTTDLLVELSAEFGDDDYDATKAAAAFAILDRERVAGNGPDGVIGDIDLGRVRDLFEEVVPAWRRADVPISAGVDPDDIVTNRFIDTTIGR